MENWLLYMLVFIFGYSTCRTFYFIRANRISLSLIKLSHMIYLSATIKALESLYAVRAKIKMSDIEPLTPDEVFEEEIKTLKENSVAYLLQLHPKFYRDVLKFSDWESSMSYLDKNKEAVFKIWNKNND